MKSDLEDMDPLRLKEWFTKPYSVTVTTVLLFFLVLYRAWLYIADWLEGVLVGGLTPGDVTFIKALTFILVLLIANIVYMVLSKQVGLLRTVVDQEKKLYLCEMKFQSFIDNVPDVAVQGFDPDCTVIYWNTASEKMYGYPKNEAMGKKLTELIVPCENQNDFVKIIGSMQKDRTYVGASENNFLTKAGEKIPVFSSYSAVQVPEDQVEIFSMEIDLTERKRMEETLLEAKEIAEASNTAKSKFLAGMSHEIRTPLNAIIGFSDLLINNFAGPLNGKQMKYASNISTSGKHLLGIINDILDLSKAEAGKMEIQYELISVPLIVQEIADVMRPAASSRGITITTDIESDVGMVEADSGKLKQILYNLIGNASKFSIDGGNISIRTRVVEGFMKFEVKDEGVGIKEEDLPKLFKPFSQVDGPTEGNTGKKHEGTGLGLSLVKKLVELHGGDVWVKSEYGKYSIFGFSLPLHRPAVK
ncbi:PAS domain S-box protein [Methanosarcina sp. KYL-1]|uniref:PAS domain-containing sensor histidine kinase n=1 Tax=Methanosarcina sp. KYL-1 TaxID=2602068 RepID=UPI002101004E|nr:PAS domain-containing hybrid sensor histidine kinase/response regulator [Methanosarcina sp. KYL-1]MCQ1537128.1 PAS domain S-box protein [Methanosarcina sp. KYL-1]